MVLISYHLSNLLKSVIKRQCINYVIQGLTQLEKFIPLCLFKLRTLGVKYDIITSAPALRIDIKDSRTAAFKSKAPALAECTNIANSPDTLKYKYCKIKYILISADLISKYYYSYSYLLQMMLT